MIQSVQHGRGRFPPRGEGINKLMRFLPENKNRALTFVGIIIVSVGGIIYFNFFFGPPSPKPVSEAEIRAAAPPPAPQSESSKKLRYLKPKSGVLPYGTAVDTSVLDSEPFSILKPTARLELLDSELGKTNLFE